MSELKRGDGRIIRAQILTIVEMVSMTLAATYNSRNYETRRRQISIAK